jgi:Tfp pilus assembly protein PilE
MRNNKGFTLIELCIITVIIGALAAIAISQYASYRTRGLDAAAKSDLRNACLAQEAYFVGHQCYTDRESDLVEYKWVKSEGVVLVIGAVDNNSYHMEAKHASGNLTWKVDGPGGQMYN